ncbi:hypothetical protein M569_15892 [Genlisea aurea]|uniref:Uncharacterized protein n=1 Tax=Genlisea aurea TaxID=192259 RepID=S8BWG7_9LAMI|nr:hypothetical protein M569_15892 [Genlisea aurea]
MDEMRKMPGIAVECVVVDEHYRLSATFVFDVLKNCSCLTISCSAVSNSIIAITSIAANSRLGPRLSNRERHECIVPNEMNVVSLDTTDHLLEYDLCESVRSSISPFTLLSHRRQSMLGGQ